LVPAVDLTGQAWQPEQLLYSALSDQKDQKPSCGQMPSTTTMVCVYETHVRGQLHLYEIRSRDGGVTWSAPVQVTAESSAEFDPYIATDLYRGKLWLLYSHNVSRGNDLVIRQKLCESCPWSDPTVVIGDGANHWDASLLVLNNGDILALEQLEGPGGNGAPGKIRSIRSLDGGVSWRPPSVIYDGPGEELFPRAVQKVGGVIHLMFRVSAQYPKLQIGQVWSNDNGYTWTGYSVFRYNFTQDQEFTFIGSQGGQNITVLASIAGYINYWTSWDNGGAWVGPYRVSSVDGGEDGEMVMGCRGPILLLDDHANNVWAKRYDAYSNCQ
jgi:hypothetical protein